MKNRNNKGTLNIGTIITVGIFLLTAIAFTVLIINSMEGEDNVEELPKALLDTEVLSLNENLYDSTELFYTYRVDNFGNAEARNINVRCKLTNENGITVSSTLGNIGNLASNSTTVEQLTINNIPFSVYEGGTYFCYVESCTNCEILYKKIPELVEYYEN